MSKWGGSDLTIGGSGGLSSSPFVPTHHHHQHREKEDPHWNTCHYTYYNCSVEYIEALSLSPLSFFFFFIWKHQSSNWLLSLSLSLARCARELPNCVMRAATSFFFFDSFKPLWLPKTAKGLGLRCCISQWEREGEPRIDTERAAPGDKRGPGTAGARTTIHQIIEFLLSLSLSLDGWSSIYLLCSNEKRSRDRHLYIKSDADNSFVPFRFSSEGRRLHRDYSVSKQKGFRFSFSVTKEEIVNWQRLYNPSTPTHNVSSVVFAEANSRRGVCCVSRPERERERNNSSRYDT